MPHDTEKLMDALAPSGIAAIMERVQGVGRVMVSIRGLDTNIDVQNVRTLEKVTIGWEDFLEKLREIYAQMDLSDPYAAWEVYYQEPFQKKEEIAPAQKKPEKKEETRHEKREKPAGDPAGSGKLPEGREDPGRGEPEGTESQEPGTEDQKTGTEEKDPSGQQEEQIPGQDNILNHPELLPPGMPTMEAKVDGQTVPAEVEPTVNQRKEKCLELATMIRGNIEIENYAAAEKCVQQLLEHLERLK